MRKRVTYPDWTCLNCGKEHAGRGSSYRDKYCDNQCQSDHIASVKTKLWLEQGVIWNGVKDWLINDQDHKCSICHMSDEWNGLPLVFVMDHIDGNADNNWRSNLRCICPNCNAQLPTHAGANRGKGRAIRRARYIKGLSINTLLV